MKRRLNESGEGDGDMKRKRASGSAPDACDKWAKVLNRHTDEPVVFDRVGERIIVPIIGSYNAGKSALVNRLISEELLISAPVEQTAVPWCILQPDSDPPAMLQNRFPHIVFVNAARMPYENIVLVDTPGYGGVDPVDVCLEPLLSVSHAALLCISSQTPVTLSDIAILKQLRHFRHKLFIALTKADLCKEGTEMDAVVASVKARLSPVLHYSPDVYPVSSLLESPFEFAKLTGMIYELDRSATTRRTLLLRRALDVLSVRSDDVVQDLEKRRQKHHDEAIKYGEMTSRISQMVRDIISGIGACRHALRRQIHLQPSGNEGPALSAPLSGLRTQIDHAVISVSRDYKDISQDELSLFRQETSKKLRQAEAVMESSNEPDHDDSSRSYEKGITATSAAGVMIATALNPAVGISAAVAWFAASRLISRKSDEKDAVHRKLMGIPLAALDLIASDVNRLEKMLSGPLLENGALQESEASALHGKIAELERVGRVCRRDINADIDVVKKAE